MSDAPVPAGSEILLYTTPDSAVRVEVYYQAESFWLTQRRMAELFGVEVHTINYHCKEIFASKELREDRTIRKFRIVQQEGSREVARDVDFYNLDVVIAVGYRVNSFQATQFRIWATTTLREFIVKGFVLDAERLKQGKQFGADYFEELLERIREIRASERRFYLKITDIYEKCSTDYDPNAEIAKTFFKTVQNKLHWAITKKTAAEIVAGRTDSSKRNMGLTTWKNAPKESIRKSDVVVAKNYLDQREIRELERIVSMYLDLPRANTRSSASSAIGSMSAISKNRSSKSEPDKRLKKRRANELASFLRIHSTRQFAPPQNPVTRPEEIFFSHALINLRPTSKNPTTSFLDTPR